MAKLGFLGLGVMGSQMVSRLLDKGHTVTGYNRTRSKAEWLVGRGMKWGDSPRAVAAASDFIFSMVTNAEAVKSLAEGPDGYLAGLAPGKVIIDMSTVSPTDQPRDCRESTRKRRGSGGFARVRQRDHVAGRKTVGDGRRAPRNIRSRAALAAGRGPESFLRGRQWSCAGHEDCHQPEPGRADARFFRRRFARGKKRNFARGRRGRSHQQRDRLANG